MMRRGLLQRALEEMAGDDKLIQMKGPLAEVFTEALNIAYKKEVPQASGDGTVGADTDKQQPVKVADPLTETIVTAMESQAIDAAIAEHLASSITSSDVTPTDNFQTVYGVSKANVSEDTIVDVTKELANNPENSEFVLIIDGTLPGGTSDGPSERFEQLTGALECMVTAFHGRVYSSLPEYLKTRSRGMF